MVTLPYDVLVLIVEAVQNPTCLLGLASLCRALAPVVDRCLYSSVSLLDDDPSRLKDRLVGLLSSLGANQRRQRVKYIRISLAFNSHDSLTPLFQLFKSCPNLQHVKFHNANRLPFKTIEMLPLPASLLSITFECNSSEGCDLAGLLMQCPFLESLSFNSDKSLASLPAHSSLATPYHTLSLPSLPNLARLTLYESCIPDHPESLLAALSPVFKHLELIPSTTVGVATNLSMEIRKHRLRNFLEGLHQVRPLASDFQLILNGQLGSLLPPLPAVDELTLKRFSTLNPRMNLPLSIRKFRMECQASHFDDIVDLLRLHRQKGGSVETMHIAMINPETDLEFVELVQYGLVTLSLFDMKRILLEEMGKGITNAVVEW